MPKGNFNRSDDRRGEKIIFKSIVKLQKDLNGVVHARPSMNDNIVESRIPSAKSSSIQNVSGGIENQVANFALLKKPNRVRCILLTVLGIWLISKHKKLSIIKLMYRDQKRGELMSESRYNGSE